MLLTISYSDSAYSITRYSRREHDSTIILEFQHIFVYFIHINKIKFTYDKLETVKFGSSIFENLLNISGSPIRVPSKSINTISHFGMKIYPIKHI